LNETLIDDPLYLSVTESERLNTWLIAGVIIEKIAKK
jgi:hypothetical protein